MKIPQLKDNWLDCNTDITSLLLLKEHVQKAEKLLAKIEAIPDPLYGLLEIEEQTVELFNKYKGDMLNPILGIKVRALKEKQDKLRKESENYNFIDINNTTAQLKVYITSTKTKLANLEWYSQTKSNNIGSVNKTLQASQYMIDFVNRGI